MSSLVRMVALAQAAWSARCRQYRCRAISARPRYSPPHFALDAFGASCWTTCPKVPPPSPNAGGLSGIGHLACRCGSIECQNPLHPRAPIGFYRIRQGLPSCSALPWPQGLHCAPSLAHGCHPRPEPTPTLPALYPRRTRSVLPVSYSILAYLRSA